MVAANLHKEGHLWIVANYLYAAIYVSITPNVEIIVGMFFLKCFQQD